MLSRKQQRQIFNVFSFAANCVKKNLCFEAALCSPRLVLSIILSKNDSFNATFFLLLHLNTENNN